MAVTRIVANIATDRLEDAKSFYCGILGMETVMDHGWIVTLAGSGTARSQLSFASEGGSGQPVPDLSIEVDDIESIYQAVVKASLSIEYGPALEPWAVRRFFVRDPLGRLVNVLAHERPDSGEPRE